MREQHLIDKSEWPAGPWQQEPDRVSWTDEKTGLDCLAKRHTDNGHWCGYVAITPDLLLRTRNMPHADVHGGITYTQECDGNPETGVCHIAKDNKDDDVLWVGFDCAHYGDMSPNPWSGALEDNGLFSNDGVYRTLDYVKAECRSLAKQVVDYKEEEEEEEEGEQ